MSTRAPFQSVRSEGAILPMDLLQRVADQDPDLGGLLPQDYGLAKNEKLGEAVSRSWNRLQGLWKGFGEERLRLNELEDARGTTETREQWLLPLFEELGYGRLKTQTYDVEGKRYPVSHGSGHTPVHLLSYKLDLDRRAAGVAGAATYAPHAMMQEMLNRSERHLWAVLTNGLKLRILRDNASLTRQAYVEFDLEAMFEGDAYADFSVLWLVAHASRTEGEVPEECRLEKWSAQAHEQGTRALDALRDGVERAIEHLGAGFIAHPTNDALRAALHSGALDRQDYYRQLLRLVYRLIFLFTAEDRDALLDPDGDDEAKKRYTGYYSTAALRTLAEKRRGSERHGDRWEQLRLVMRALGRTGEPRLALPALGSFLWSEDAIGTLAESRLANEAFLEAVRALSLIEHERVRRSVDYKNLGPEELGGIYESLLELQPRLNLDARTFALETVAGSERKTTGSYYTPEPLIQALLDTALDPVLDRAERADDPEAALLALKVCDPAVGSGHFLIAAAHRIAGRLARVRAAKAEGGEPTTDQHQRALRDVIGRCVYGVDLNPMALELCKVNLWLEALEPGKPLSFLDHHLQVGNGLLGATPRALQDGIPDQAFKPITGDVKAYADEYKKQNRTFRKKHQHDMFAEQAMPWERLGNMPEVIAGLDDLPSDDVEDVERKARRYAEAVSSQGYVHARLLADAWCAAFVWKKRPGDDLPHPIHEEVFRKIEKNPHATPDWMRREVGRLAERYRFFHWHLAFPDVFRVPGAGEAPTDETTGWSGGFDCVLGNPPWERTSFEEVPYFSSRVPEIAAATTTAVRGTLIKALEGKEPQIYNQYLEDRRAIKAEDLFYSNSGCLPLSSGGRTNTYALFTDRFTQICAPSGYIGIIVPTGIATHAPMQKFWASLSDKGKIVSLRDFENRPDLFPGVHKSYKFCLLTLAGSYSEGRVSEYGFYLDQVVRRGGDERHFGMSPDEISLVNPETRQPPICRSRTDFLLLLKLHRSSSFLSDNYSAWVGLTSSSSSSEWLDSDEVSAREGNLVCLYESKMIHQFDHRFATYEGVSQKQRKKGKPVPCHLQKQSADFEATPRFLVPRDVASDLLSRKTDYANAIACYRDVARSTDVRTSIAAVVPMSGLMQPLNGLSASDAEGMSLLVANLNSFATDFAVRQKTSDIHVNVTIASQLPVLSPETYRQPSPWAPGQTLAGWLRPRVLELTYTAWDLQPFAEDVGYDGPPFVWDEARREKLRAELDAAFFHLYLGPPEDWAEEPEALRQSFPTPRDAVAYVMDTFPIVKRKDEKEHGSYRTKDMILAVYDRMQQAAEAGTAYATLLDPPPASPAVAHPEREVEA